VHYHNGLSAAARIGISYKTLLRYIEKGRIVPEEAKTPTGQLVISEDQVERLRREVQHERDIFKRTQPATPSSRQHETPVDSQEIPLTDTTLNETLKQIGKLQAKTDVQQARITELERRVQELEARPENVVTSPASTPTMEEIAPTTNHQIVTTEPSSDMLSAREFASQLGISWPSFEGMLRHGIGRGEDKEYLERTEVPIAAREGYTTKWFDEKQREKAIEVLKRHGRIK
jgi:DNA-binding transcriptional MerR regulator